MKTNNSNKKERNLWKAVEMNTSKSFRLLRENEHFA